MPTTTGTGFGAADTARVREKTYRVSKIDVVVQCIHCQNDLHNPNSRVLAMTLTPSRENLAASLWVDRCRHCRGDNLRLLFRVPVESDNLSRTFAVTELKDLQLDPFKRPRKLSSEVDDASIREDFEEAATLLTLSPRVSGALARRCLQQILRTKGRANPGKLFDEIAEVIGSGALPHSVSMLLERLRAKWQGEAGQTKNRDSVTISDVQPGEADFTLDLVDVLTKFYWVLPASAKNGPSHHRTGYSVDRNYVSR